MFRLMALSQRLHLLLAAMWVALYHDGVQSFWHRAGIMSNSRNRGQNNIKETRRHRIIKTRRSVSRRAKRKRRVSSIINVKYSKCRGLYARHRRAFYGGRHAVPVHIKIMTAYQAFRAPIIILGEGKPSAHRKRQRRPEGAMRAAAVEIHAPSEYRSIQRKTILLYADYTGGVTLNYIS